MKTLAELEADLAKLQAEIAELKKPKGGRYVPRSGDMVYTVSHSAPSSFAFTESEDNKHRRALGLFVPTIEEYHKRVAEFKAREKLLRCEGARREFKTGGDNYYISKDNVIFTTLNNRYGHISTLAYFDTQKQVEAALNSLIKEELEALFPVIGGVR